MTNALDDARDVDIDIEEAWTITVTGLRRRRRARRAGYAVAMGMVLLVAVGFASLLTTGDERVGVSVQPDPPTTMVPSNAERPSLTHIQWRTGGGIAIDTRVGILTELVPFEIAAGQEQQILRTFKNVTATDVDLGTGGARLLSYVTDERGQIVGGSATAGHFTGPGYSYGVLHPNEEIAMPIDVRAVGAQGLAPTAGPLEPGRYLLWIESPSPGAAQTVAGPLALDVTP